MYREFRDYLKSKFYPDPVPWLWLKWIDDVGTMTIADGLILDFRKEHLMSRNEELHALIGQEGLDKIHSAFRLGGPAMPESEGGRDPSKGGVDGTGTGTGTATGVTAGDQGRGTDPAVGFERLIAEIERVYKNYLDELSALIQYNSRLMVDYDLSLTPALQATHLDNLGRIKRLREETETLPPLPVDLDRGDLALSADLIDDHLEKYRCQLDALESSERVQLLKETEGRCQALLERRPTKAEVTAKEYNQWRDRSNRTNVEYWEGQRRSILENQKWNKERNALQGEVDSLRRELDQLRTGISGLITYWERVKAARSDWDKRTELQRRLEALGEQNDALLLQLKFHQWIAESHEGLSNDRKRFSEISSAIGRDLDSLREFVQYWKDWRTVLFI